MRFWKAERPTPRRVDMIFIFLVMMMVRGRDLACTSILLFACFETMLSVLGTYLGASADMQSVRRQFISPLG